jgi:hypothetical protein
MSDTDRDNEYRIKELHAALDRRIERIEDRIRYARAFQGTALLVSIAALGFASFGVSQLGSAYFPGDVAPLVEARAIVLRDADGLERAALRSAGDGGVTLSFTDGRAQPRLRLSVLEDGSPGVSLLDSEGDTRAILGLLADGTTSLVFADAGSVARSVLALTPDGSSRIIFSDHLGDARAAVGVDGTGQPELSTREVAPDGT